MCRTRHPIPDDHKNSIEQGPCGYTYRNDTNGAPISITVTSTWTVRWELSDGRTGSGPDIIVVTDHPYQIYEIQTVGKSG